MLGVARRRGQLERNPYPLLNAQGGFSPRKHTLDVAPMTTTVIEFAAEQFGDWFFHCHLLYHLMRGMARVVHYHEFAPDPAAAAVRPQLYHDPFYLYGRVNVLSQMTHGALVYATTRHSSSTEWGPDGSEWTTWSGRSALEVLNAR